MWIHVCACVCVHACVSVNACVSMRACVQWSEQRQLRSEALGSIPSGYPCIFSSVCFYPDLLPVAYHQFLPPVVVNQYIVTKWGGGGAGGGVLKTLRSNLAPEEGGGRLFERGV